MKNKKINKGISALVILTLIMACVAFPTGGYDLAYADTQDEIDQAQQNVKDIEQQQEEVQGELADVAAKIESVQAEIDEINARLAATEDGLPAVSVSVGIVHGSDAASGADLFEKTDAAMYEAKQSGKHTHKFYEGKAQTESEEP